MIEPAAYWSMYITPDRYPPPQDVLHKKWMYDVMSMTPQMPTGFHILFVCAVNSLPVLAAG